MIYYLFGYIRISQSPLVDFINYGGALKTVIKVQNQREICSRLSSSVDREIYHHPAGNCVAPCGGFELFLPIQYHGLTPVAKNVSPAARASIMQGNSCMQSG